MGVEYWWLGKRIAEAEYRAFCKYPQRLKHAAWSASLDAKRGWISEEQATETTRAWRIERSRIRAAARSAKAQRHRDQRPNTDA